MASVDCSTKIGIASAAAPVAWAGNGGSRNVADWLPQITEDFLDKRTGKISARWYNYFRALGDRLGGVNGQSITQVVSTQSQVQAQVAETLNYAVEGVAYASQVAATAQATAEVAASNGLSGAGSIPETGDPPPRPGTYAR